MFGSIINLLSSPVPWYLTSLDNEFPFQMQAEFEPESLKITRGANINRRQLTGGGHPIVQWLNNNEVGLSFSAFARAKWNWIPVNPSISVLLNENITDKQTIAANDVYDFMQKLNLCITKNDELGRNPNFVFTWGDAIEMNCLIQSLDYDPTLYRVSGYIETLRLNMTLVSIVNPFEAAASDLGIGTLVPLPSESLTHIVTTDETYEQVALKEYKNPLKGVNLRNRNPDYPIIQEADKITVVKPDHDDITAAIEPQSIQLKYSETQFTAFQETLDARNLIDIESHIIETEGL